MVVGFGSIGGWCYSGWWVWVGFENIYPNSGKWNVSTVIPRQIGIADEHSVVVVMTARFQSRRSQILSYG